MKGLPGRGEGRGLVVGWLSYQLVSAKCLLVHGCLRSSLWAFDCAGAARVYHTDDHDCFDRRDPNRRRCFEYELHIHLFTICSVIR